MPSKESNNKTKAPLTGIDEVRRALENPIDTPRLNRMAFGKTDVVIITGGIAENCPSHMILPSVMDELCAAGVELECITVIYAHGGREPLSRDEMRAHVGDIVFSCIRCINADPGRTVNLGTTSHNTPVEIFGEAAYSDLRICIGAVEQSDFAGYTGGYDAILPGAASHEAIRINRALANGAESVAGIYENPVREDINEMENFCRADFIINVILNESGEITRCTTGSPLTAHSAIVRRCEARGYAAF